MKYIFIIAILYAFQSCKKDSTILGNTSSKLTESNKNDSLVGKYYTEHFRPGSDFTMLKENPAKNSVSVVFELNFLPSGKINVTDLTNMYMCGNGILLISDAEWKNLGDNIYQLHFKGEYALELKFDFVGNYKLTSSGNDKQMTLLKTIALKENRI